MQATSPELNLRLMSRRRIPVCLKIVPLYLKRQLKSRSHLYLEPRSGTQVQRTSLAPLEEQLCLQGTRCLTPTGLHGWLMLRHNLKLVLKNVGPSLNNGVRFRYHICGYWALHVVLRTKLLEWWAVEEISYTALEQSASGNLDVAGTLSEGAQWIHLSG